jgi:hypothetical protein
MVVVLEETVVGISDVDWRAWIGCLPRVTKPKEDSHHCLETGHLIGAKDDREWKDKLREIVHLSKHRAPKCDQSTHSLQSLRDSTIGDLVKRIELIETRVTLSLAQSGEGRFILR